MRLHANGATMDETRPVESTLPAPGVVHVWHIPLDAPGPELESYRHLLNETERSRERRLIRQEHRDRFVVGRGRLRLLLGRYLQRSAESIAFCYGPQGKPALSDPPPDGPFSFNLSHSADHALCAIAGFSTVGIDIESVKESRDLVPIARRFFSETERANLLALPPALQCPAFYQCWTSKEALLKAWGTGLITPLDKFTVSVLPGKTEVCHIDLPEWSATPWRLYSVDAPKGFAATLATPGPLQRLTIQSWEQP